MSKRIDTSGGVIQRANGTSAAGSGSVICDLLGDLAHRRRAVRDVALALVRVDRAAGEHPGAAHEARLRRALDHQHLEPLARRRAGRPPSPPAAGTVGTPLSLRIVPGSGPCAIRPA